MDPRPKLILRSSASSLRGFESLPFSLVFLFRCLPNVANPSAAHSSLCAFSPIFCLPSVNCNAANALQRALRCFALLRGGGLGGSQRRVAVVLPAEDPCQLRCSPSVAQLARGLVPGRGNADHHRGAASPLPLCLRGAGCQGPPRRGPLLQPRALGEGDRRPRYLPQPRHGHLRRDLSLQSSVFMSRSPTQLPSSWGPLAETYVSWATVMIFVAGRIRGGPWAGQAQIVTLRPRWAFFL